MGQDSFLKAMTLDGDDFLELDAKENEETISVTNEVHEDFEKIAEEEQQKLLEAYEKENQDLTSKEKSSRMAALSHLLEQSAVWASIIAEKFAKDKEARLKAEVKREKASVNGKRTKDSTPSLSSTMTTRKKRKTLLTSPSDENENPFSPSTTPLSNQDNVEEEDKNQELTSTTNSTSSTTLPPFSKYFHGTLADYQLEGIQWLDTLYSNGLNGILADEMGLGKTVQSIGFFCHLMQQNVWGYFLVVVPLSTLTHWEMEFTKFAPKLPIFVYHGNKQERKEFQKQLLSPMPFKRRPVIITSYEMVVMDVSFFQKIPFRFMVVDEGHRLKNFQCVLIRVLKSLQSENRILLTGTPLQNDLSELWSLLNFLVPEIFNDVENFLQWFDFEMTENKLNKKKILNRQLTDNMVTKIHKILSPFMLRRIKEDVKLNLPPKKELIVYTPMTKEQKELYMSIKEKRADTYFANLFSSHNLPPPRPFTYSTKHMVMAARRACCHPFLFPHPLYSHATDSPDFDALVSTSGKMRLLDKLLPALLPRHKLILFSQFTTMLDLLVDYLTYRAWNYARVDGQVPHLQRREAIHQFTHDPNTRVFLSSTRAGGLGINLSVANIVILFDSDWNPQQDLQAQDRAHRIGQTLPVTVFRLVSEHSFENKMVERAQAKRQLEKMIIGQGHFHSPMLMNQQESLNEKDPSLFMKTLEKLLEENDGENIHVLKDGEEAISDEALQTLLNECVS